MAKPITTKAWIKKLESKEYSKNTQEKFRDFCELVYCAYAKLTSPTPKDSDVLEERYMRTVNTYQDKDCVRMYPELLADVINAVGNSRYEPQDFLGMVAAEINILDERGGQYFTPMNICRMMAQMHLEDISQHINEKDYITLSEPCAGSGSMVLAFAEELHRKGYNPPIHMLVQATELNQLSYQMCFIQLTVAGIAAAVIHGNSLSLEVFESAWTPTAISGFYCHHGHLSFNAHIPKALSSEEEPHMRQLSLF